MSRKTLLHFGVSLLFISLYVIPARGQGSRSDKGKLFLEQLRPSLPRPTFRHAEFRTYDGRNNNISNNQSAAWGAADIPLYREMPAYYGPRDPKNEIGGTNRPSPRQISNVLCDEPVTIFNARKLSTFVYQWGQFLDHDMSLTPTDTIEYVPIKLPADELTFTEDIPFYRSEVRAGTGIKNVRQQTNLNTSWIDGSVVYGSDASRAKWLRTFSNGKLKTSAGNLMPYNTTTGEFSAEIDPDAPGMANDGGGTIKTFVAGDVRAAENPVLTSIHTIFVREHNRICDRLIAEGLRKDEEIYQKARKEVGAIIQAITYQEFLPAMGVTLRRYSGYNTNVRGDIMNSFATASYRLGHTMVSDDVVMTDNDCEEVGPGELDLVETFWNPQLVIDYGMEAFLRGAVTHDQYETNTKINDVLRNFLFVSPNDPVRFGIDLASLNIQRGRDHGLPDYNSARKFYTGRAVNKFSDISSNDTIRRGLKSLYGDVNNIDLWIGILSEDLLPGTSVGRTLHEMLREQFEHLRDGDYYFYLNDPYLPQATRNSVKNTKFSEVLARNTTLTSLPANVFLTLECSGGDEDDPLKTTAGKPVSSASAGETDPNIAGPNNVRVYPNPSADIINIDLGDANGSSVIKIYTTNGVLVKTVNTAAKQKSMQVDISAYTDGVYYVNISTAKGARSFKFVKLAK